MNHFIKLHDLKGNPILINTNKIYLIIKDGNNSKIDYGQNTYYGEVKESLEEIEQLLNRKMKFLKRI